MSRLLTGRRLSTKLLGRNPPSTPHGPTPSKGPVQTPAVEKPSIDATYDVLTTSHIIFGDSCNRQANLEHIVFTLNQRQHFVSSIMSSVSDLTFKLNNGK